MSYATERALAKCSEAEALLNRAADTRESQWMQHAISCYGQAIELDPDLPEPYLALADLCLYYEQPEQALTLVTKALDLSPDEPRAKELWSDLQLMLNQENERSQSEE